MTQMLVVALSALVLSANVYAVPKEHGRLDSTANNSAISNTVDGSHHTSHSASRCARQYKINVGDTCDKISADQKTSTYQLSSLNPKINSACTNLIIGDMLCLGLKNRDCTTIYVVKKGDICAKIAAKTGISLSDLFTNNPNINQGCTNIYTGEVLCVAPATGSSSPTTSISDSDLPDSSSPSFQGGDISSDTPLVIPSADTPLGIPSTPDNAPSQGDVPSFPAALMNLTLPVDMNSTINGIPPIKSDTGSDSPFNMTLPLGMNSTVAGLTPGGPGGNSTVAGSSTSSSTAPNPSPN